MWKHRQKKFMNYKRSEDKPESSGQTKTSIRDVVCYECKEPGHYRSDCPKLQRERQKKIFGMKKGMRQPGMTQILLKMNLVLKIKMPT